MGVIYFITLSTEASITLTLICSVLYLVFLYFSWVPHKINLSKSVAIISHSLLLLIVTAFIIVISFYPHVHSYLMWVVVSGIILVLTAVRISYTAHHFTSFIYKMMTLWLPAVYFSAMVFLWVLEDIGDHWFILNLIICYIVFVFGSFYRENKNVSYIDTQEIENYRQESFSSKQDVSANSKDEATNLPSQQQALSSINQALKQHPYDNFAIIVFKPVNFQQVNKIIGHQNSDILLLQLSYCLQKNTENNIHLLNFSNNRNSIRIARLRGLHFLVVLQLKKIDVNRNVHVEKLCQALTQAVPDAMSFKSFSLNFQLTFGISYLDKYGSSVSEVIAYAEDALLSAENEQLPLSYFNKEEVIYTQSHLLEMERLKEDIIHDKLHWTVQPQTRLKDRKLVGFELLVQWHNAKNQPIEFKEFIDTAEHSGEIYLLTKQMITRAFKLILKLQRISNYETVSIKLLSQYLLEPDLVSFIEKQIAFYNVPAKYLVIELPEKIVLSASDRAKTIIDELKSLNINIGISDFSGSYESLRYIRKMAVHQVKIDCERIGLADDEPENAIITSLIDLTQKMNLPLIGTSINDKSTEQAFSLIGGELAQGDIVDKGVATDKIDTWVSTWNSLYNPV